MKKIVVGADGSGDYKTIAEALENAEDGMEIFIKKGIYKERPVVDKKCITFTGEDKEKTILTYNSAARDLDESGNEIGTFKTATLKVTNKAEGFKMSNLTVENSAGMGNAVGQAVALYLDCDKAEVENCILKARQDTLLTAPMHEDIARNPEILNRQYFKNCLIEGDVDFIFGGATAVFEDCEIKSLDRHMEHNGYVTAACTAKEIKYGYVFFNCDFTTDSCNDETVYLGRPWREYAKTVMINCRMGKHISKDGFSVWNNTDRHKTCYYAQYGTVGENYDEAKLADWTHVLSKDEAAAYTVGNIFEGWNPQCR